MFGTVIRTLLDRKLTTIRDIEEITGRGSSTIYRWMNGESEPHHTDMRLLIRHLPPDARRTLLSLLTADLPIVINWLPDQTGEEQSNDDRQQGYEVFDQSLLALDCLTHALSEGNDALRKQELSKERYVSLISLIDETIRHLTTSKNLLQKYAPI